MSKHSLIQWTQHTINFWWGCSEVSPACAHCYAREWAKFASRQLFGQVVHWGKGHMRAERLGAAHREAMALEREAAKLGVRYRVFANSMSDWLDEEVPILWLAVMLRTIRQTPHLDWQLLTKRPQNWQKRLAEACIVLDGEDEQWASNWLLFKDAPENIWIGTTVENQTYADLRIPQLLAIPAAVRFLSCEPLLGPVDFLQVSDSLSPEGHPWSNARILDGIHWVICGGESGPHARPMHPDWARFLRDQCQAAGVAFHFKQWGEWEPTVKFDWKARRHFLERDGRDSTQWDVSRHSAGTANMQRVGKKAAGRLLDGREWNELPRQGGLEDLKVSQTHG